MKAMPLGILVASALTLSGCVSSLTPDGAPLSGGDAPESATEESEAVDLKPYASPIPAGMGRIVVFRGSTWGLVPNMISPNIRIDGEIVGSCQHQAIVMEDRPIGTHEVSIQTDVINKQTVEISDGQVVYLKCNVAPIGILLPAPMLEVVPAEKVPDKVASLQVQ